MFILSYPFYEKNRPKKVFLKRNVPIHPRSKLTRFSRHNIYNLKAYQWTPEELAEIISHFLSTTYGYDISTFVQFDQYKGYFNISLVVEDDFDEYEEFINQFVEDFMYDQEKKKWNMHTVNWTNFLDRILREIIGAKLMMIKPVDEDVCHMDEYTWNSDKDPAYFFFY